MAAHSAGLGGAGARRPQFQIDRRSLWLDTVIVGGIYAAILFNLVLGPLTVIIVFGAICAFCLLRWERLPGVVLECWPLFLMPAMVFVSALWSDVPYITLRYGLLYAITVFAGIIVGAGAHRSSYVNGYFWAFAIYSVASILFGRWVGWGEGPGDAYAGLAGSKNASGDMAGLATLATIMIIHAMIVRRRWAAVFGSAALLPIVAWLLLSSRATGALIATVLTSACMIAWLLSGKFERQVRGGIFVGLTIVAVAALVTQRWWLPPIFELVLEASGKDAGLTGRSDLWVFGDQLISERPWLGLGYNAFWLPDNVGAQYLLNMMGVDSGQGFNFHNTAMEITVHLGYVGLVLTGVMVAAGAFMLLFKSLKSPSPSNILACTLLLYFALKVPFEVVGFGPMHFSTVAVYGFLAVGLRREGNPRPRLSPSRRRRERERMLR
tara:strand:+ start:54714 stop:56024 length:1311 start_codon:yes stop_codon:yes gene_type:complete